MEKYLYKKDLIGIEGNHKYADFVVANSERILKEDAEKFWFEDAPVYEPTIQEKIIKFEGQLTPRRLREALLGNTDSIAFVQEIEDKIASLRTLN
jgi:hypothetical protein